MGQTGRFYNDLEAAFGKGNVTSGFRTQAEQDALIAAGATRAKRSSHTYENGYDLSINAARDEAEVRAKAASQGLQIGRVIREGGGRNQGTGPHWHVELLDMAGPQAGGVAANSSRPGQGVANPEAFLAGLESQLGPEAMASGGVRTTAPGTFGSDQALQTRADAVEGALAQQGAGIDVLTSVVDAAQAVQLASMADQVNESRAISTEISEGTEQLRRQVQPVFQARGRIADQLDKLNTMNPLERGLRSIFDLNYDRGFLKSQLDNYDRTLEMRANDFDYMNKLHESALGEIGRRYELDNAIPQLSVAQAEEDLGIVGMRIQQTAGLLGSLRDRVSGESQLISAKALAREDMLQRIDGPTTMALANQARQGNGTVVHNGVEFSYAELRDRLERDEDQELNREAHRMAIASGRMDMAEKYAINLARSLTRQQAEAAIAAGGTYQGIQLPQDVLQNIYQGHVQTAATQAESIANSMPSAMALRVGTDELNRITSIQHRTRSMFGGAGVPDIATNLQNGAEMIRALIEATEAGAPPEVITALTQRIAQNSAQVDKRLDQALLRQAGGNKEAAGYLKSFVLGSPMDSAASVQAITYFAIQGARPDGIAMTPEAKQVFQQAERIVREIRAESPRIGIATLRQQVASQLSDYAAKTVGAARYERVSRDLPRIAQRTGHVFGKLAPQQWSQVRTEASSEAYAAIADELGTDVANVRLMRTTGKPIDTTPEAQQLFDGFMKQIGNFNAVEHSALIRGLDELPMITPGRRNSSLMIDFMSGPEIATIAETYTKSAGQESFGDYVVNPISAGALESFMGQDAEGLRVAQSDVTRSQRQTARETAAGYGANPLMRSITILSGIEGVGPEGAKKLTPFLQEVTQRVQENTTYQLGDTGNSMMIRQENAVLNALQQTKFEDPAMEAYRKVAIRGWNKVATQADGFFGTMVKLISGQEY